MRNGKDQSVRFVSVATLRVVSLLFGVMTASLLPILLNFRRCEFKAVILLMPGGIFASFLAPNQLAPHPLLLLVCSAIFYAVCLFGLCLAFRQWLTPRLVRLGIWLFGLASVALFALACIPHFNPLWPHGIEELHAREAKLKNLIRSDMTMDQIRVALQKESIPLNEEVEEATRDVLRSGTTHIVASAGDRILFGRFRTDAVQYPCGYDLQVVVLFDPDGKLKTRYVAPLPICP